MSSKWNTTMHLPTHSDFVWVIRQSDDLPQLAYLYVWEGEGRFQVPETVGDYEGLSVEYYEDVVLWADIEPPCIPGNKEMDNGA